MARVNTDILEISELKWTGMGEFLRWPLYVLLWARTPLKKWSTHNSQKEPKIQYLDAISKMTEWSLHFQGKPFSILVIQVYDLTSNAAKPEVEQFYEDLQGLLELTPPKSYNFHYRGLECKSSKSRNTWSNRQIWPWNTDWSRAKANRVCLWYTGHSKHPLPATKEKTLHMDITRWSTRKSDWLYSLQPKMEKLYTVNKNKTRSWLWLRSWTLYCQIQI